MSGVFYDEDNDSWKRWHNGYTITVPKPAVTIVSADSWAPPAKNPVGFWAWLRSFLPTDDGYERRLSAQLGQNMHAQVIEGATRDMSAKIAALDLTKKPKPEVDESLELLNDFDRAWEDERRFQIDERKERQRRTEQRKREHEEAMRLADQRRAEETRLAQQHYAENDAYGAF